MKMQIKKFAELTGVSVRTLHYYDETGLLSPRRSDASGYRIYEKQDLERLQLILLYRTLEFPLKEIKRILDSPDFDRNKALEQQVRLLELRREHLHNLIAFARGISLIGVNNMDFSAFDTRKIDDYVAQAKAAWGKTDAWKEFEEKQKNRTEQDEKNMEQEISRIFQGFAALRTLPPESGEAQEQVRVLQQFITDNCYNCTPKILRGLGKMYAAGGSFTENIDAAGSGTAAFAGKAIEVYCDRLET